MHKLINSKVAEDVN